MLFKRASKEKFRFMTAKLGNITVEDLWDIPLGEIDILAISLSQAIKANEEGSFIRKKGRTEGRLEARFEVVKAVITQRLEDIEAKENAVAAKAKKEQLLSMIAAKENEELAGESVEDLKKMAAKL
jgi:Holliday junction resolvase-like predicted endonuclease